MNTLTNKVQLIGRLGQDVEVNEIANGSKYSRLSIATNEAYTNKDGEKVENTTWHNCVAWGKTAELIGELCNKGSRILVQGKLANRKYEDKEGTMRYVTEVIVSDFVAM